MQPIKMPTDLNEKILEHFTNYLKTTEILGGSTFKYEVALTKILPKTPNRAKPTILVAPLAWIKMQMLVKTNDIEVQWHGLVKRNPETNTYYIYDILMYPQMNTGASTTTDETEYTQWLMQFIMQDDDTFEDIRMHGHSHVNMGVGPSSRDDAYRNQMCQNCTEDDYYIFMILNKKWKMSIALYDFAENVIYDTTDVQFNIALNSEQTAQAWAEEVNKMVTQENVTYAQTTESELYDRESYEMKRDQLEMDWRDRPYKRHV